jgi:hypothetical protein
MSPSVCTRGEKQKAEIRKAEKQRGWARGGGLGKVAGMSEGKFTPQAAVLWSAIPKEARERIVANVFCVKCRDSVTIINFTGEEEKGDVILKGLYGTCGHEVVRVVETSEQDNSGN